MSGIRDRDFVNVVSELSYWQERFDSGSMVGDSFRIDCAPVIKLACDIYLRDPRGSHGARLADLYAHLPQAQSKSSAGVSAQIAQLCWDRLGDGPSPSSLALQ